MGGKTEKALAKRTLCFSSELNEGKSDCWLIEPSNSQAGYIHRKIDIAGYCKCSVMEKYKDMHPQAHPRIALYACVYTYMYIPVDLVHSFALYNIIPRMHKTRVN